MADANDLAKMVPGFEFLQTLMKGAGAALPGLPGMAAVPGMSQWIAPTLDPEEIEKRINELKTVQFWLEQNARLLGTTIQALEVQRMTLSTLKTMNLPMADLREALKVRLPTSAPAAPAAIEPAPAPAPPPAAEPAAAPPAIDPMQWWGALTQQFTEIATKAVKDSAADAARSLAGAAVKQGVAVAGKTLKKAASAPARSAAASRKPAKPRGAVK
jgi:pyruvate/2-oxoglutarate dehydrogenase complex dihydrolipoamide acyltransferase (E2) component